MKKIPPLHSLGFICQEETRKYVHSVLKMKKKKKNVCDLVKLFIPQLYQCSRVENKHLHLEAYI